MTVADFIAWLQTQDQGATVEVLVQHKAPTWESYGPCFAEPFTPELADYTDNRGIDFTLGGRCPGPPPDYANDRTLILGRKD